MVPLHNGSVYSHVSKNHWKESWLCLEQNGTLVWKRKDAYQVKGIAYLDHVLDDVSVGGWSTKKRSQNGVDTPFVISIPIKSQGEKSLTVFNSHDLDSWLDAFATVVGKWKLWKSVKRRQAVRLSEERSVDERHVEKVLKYEELVEFYKIAWQQFLGEYKHNNLEEIGDENQDIDQNGFAEQANKHAANNFAVINQENHQQQQEYTIATVHHQQTRPVHHQDAATSRQNFVVEYSNVNGKIEEFYGEEDSEEETHL